VQYLTTCRSAVLGRDRHEDNDGDGDDGLQQNDQKRGRYNTKKATDLSAHRCVLKFVNTAERFPYTSRDTITLYDVLREKGMWIRVSIVRVQ